MYWIGDTGHRATTVQKRESDLGREYGTHAHLEFERREEKCSGPKVDTHQNGLCLREANYILSGMAHGRRRPPSVFEVPSGLSFQQASLEKRGGLRLSSSLFSIGEVQEQRDLGNTPEKPISSDSSSEDDSDEEKNEKPGNEVDQQSNFLNRPSVLVLMTNTADPTAPPMETFIDHMKITKTTTASGAVRREVDLRDVLPVVLANMSPITGTQMVIGKVKGFVKPAGEDRDEQDPIENNSVRTNTMSLTEVEGTDFLSLSLFYAPTGKSQAQASNAASSSSALPTSLTGDSNDKPREIAANQKAAATAVADPQPRPGEFTAQYLRFIFLLKGTDTAVKVDKNVTAADALVL
ncbi:hypothetical protein R3P38DRAFT_2795095 [Favolaschia claudopus]|uniref:Uncharacterized protein n=1 Tax=Favolaschia claudopus TaxID=2862362 RepID=A0AAW0A7G6_9AGAR